MARRGAGEGSLYQRADGRWVAALDLDGSGRLGRRRRVLYGRSRREVQAKLRQALAEKEQGLARRDERQTVGQFLEQWLKETAIPRVRPNTARSYQSAIRNHLLPRLGVLRLARLRPQDVQSALAAIRAQGSAPGTVLQVRRVLATALGDAVRWGLVPRNVAGLVAAPAVPAPARPSFDPTSVRAVLAALSEDPFALAFAFGVLGLRAGEVAGLRWADVDLDAGLVRVRQQLQWEHGVARLVEPKTKASLRVVPITAAFAQALRRHHAAQRAQRLQLGPEFVEWGLRRGERWETHGLLFTTDVGEPLGTAALLKRLQRRLDAAGLPRWRFHDLRHAATSLLAEAGVPLKTTMAVLGHSSAQTTLDVYSHTTADGVREAIDRLERLLAPPR